LFVRCDDGNKYLIESTEGAKRLVSAQTQTAWGLTSEDFLDIDYGCDYPTFDLPLSNVVRSRDSDKLYLVDRGRAYNIDNQDQASAWGLGSLSQTRAQVNGTTISLNLTTVATLPRIVSSDNTSVSTVYLVDDSKRYAIEGTSGGDTTSYQLITGYNEIPTATMSVALLQTLTRPSETIDYSIKIGSSTYLLDHNLLRRISADAITLWEQQAPSTLLSSQSASLFTKVSTIGDAFSRDGRYYRLTSPTTLSYTADSNIASNWSAHNSPLITNLLKNKILSHFSVNKTEVSLSSTNNVRIVTCNDLPYVIERSIKAKRKVSDEGMTAWRLTNKYFYINDKACGYSEYSMPVGNIVRSRNSDKVYKLENSKAFWAYSTARAEQLGVSLSATYPQFEPDSITDNFTVTK
jgi:hypothetical protein